MILTDPKKTVKIQGGFLYIQFPFDKSTVETVKGLTDRKYYTSPTLKYWTAPNNPKNLQILMSAGFVFSESVLTVQNIMSLSDAQMKRIQALPTPLFAFQLDGVRFIQSKSGRALLADEMGLGKTAQALVWLEINHKNLPAVIVVPASLKYNWFNEIKKWTSIQNVEILHGSKAHKLTASITIINYDILTYWADVIKEHGPKCIILDECHFIKNSKTKRTRAVKKITKNVPSVIALSGTPIVNRPVEMYNAINIINPSFASNPWKFYHRYCGAKHNGFGWNFNGATNTEELHQRLSQQIMIRRKKTDVLAELPDKIYSKIPIELDDYTSYQEAERDFVSFVRKNKGDEAAERVSNAVVLAEIEGLKQLAMQGKLPQAISWVENFLESGEKLVVMAVHRFAVHSIFAAFPNISVKVDGSTSQMDRQANVDRFQTDPKIKLFVGNIKAAGVGITLTASSNVAFIELPWTPGDLQQAEDRCHRIGQKNAVNIYYLLAMNTIEEKIAKLIDDKRKVLDAVIDGKKTDKKNLLTELIKGII